MHTSIGPIENPLWHRVSGLRPHLRTHVRVQRRRSGDEQWYLLIDPSTGRFHRLNRAAYEWAGRLDGRHDVETLWRHVHDKLGEDAPTQADVMRMLAQLSDAELITVDALPELDLLLRHKRRIEQRRKLAVANPLSFKVPLFDPSSLLNALMPLVRRVCTPWGLAIWAVLIVSALLAASAQAQALAHAWTRSTAGTGFVLSVWLAYPCVKLLHEFGHAFAVRIWGGEVREMGLNLLMLTPVPYVDASAATQFAQRRRRMLVGAAGIMVELAIAAVAFFVWSATPVPWLQQLALAVMTLCTASTVLFNGNPLARFDGYYVLSDALEVPNLAARANAVVLRGLRRLVGSREAAEPEPPRMQASLALYAVLAFIYRWSVGLGLIVWLHAAHPALALAGAVWVGGSLLLQPAFRGLAFLLVDGRLEGRRRRALLVCAAAAAGFAVLLGCAPAPSATVQRGVVWPADDAVLRAETDGVLRDLFAQAGASVRAGASVAALENLDLAGEHATAIAQRAQLNVQYFQALSEDPTRASRIDAQRSALDTQIARLEQRLAALQVRAKVNGTLMLARDSAQEGHFFAQGSELGYVVGDEPVLVKVALPESQAALVQQGKRDISVRFAQAPGEAVPAQVERVAPAVTFTLPTPALGSAHGGPIASDPADPSGRRSLEPVTLVDVRVPSRHGELLGLGVWVRFEFASEPLLKQWARALRQLFLRGVGSSS